MKIFLNGKELDTECKTLNDLVLTTLKFNQGIICEYNHEITPQEKWSQINLAAEDKIELLSLVGGG